MFLLHMVLIFVLVDVSFYAGMKYGSRALTAVKDEIYGIESQIRSGAAHTAETILARIKSKIKF